MSKPATRYAVETRTWDETAYVVIIDTQTMEGTGRNRKARIVCSESIEIHAYPETVFIESVNKDGGAILQSVCNALNFCHHIEIR